MSRDWSERKYTSVEDLWCWIDEKAQYIDNMLEQYSKSVEPYTMVLMGRREMLDWLGDWLKENEATLGEIAEKWSLKEEK